jgi:hypothetical protein
MSGLRCATYEVRSMEVQSRTSYFVLPLPTQALRQESLR